MAGTFYWDTLQIIYYKLRVSKLVNKSKLATTVCLFVMLPESLYLLKETL